MLNLIVCFKSVGFGLHGAISQFTNSVEFSDPLILCDLEFAVEICTITITGIR